MLDTRFLPLRFSFHKWLFFPFFLGGGGGRGEGLLEDQDCKQVVVEGLRENPACYFSLALRVFNSF